MNYFAKNIGFLREKNKISQAGMLDSIGIKRTTWISYEKGKSQPDIDKIILIGDFFGVGVAELMTVDLSKGNLITKTEETKITVKGNLKGNPKGNLKYNTEPVDTFTDEPNIHNGNEKYNVYDLDSYAAAGIAIFISDGDRRKTKPTLYFPWLGPGIHIRIGVGGDSMHPTIKDKDKTIATWVDDIAHLRQGMVYIILDKDDGLVCKRIYRHHTKNTLEFISDNDLYKPYTRHLQDILAIFRIVEVTTTDLRPEMSEFKKELRQMRQEINQIQLLLQKN